VAKLDLTFVPGRISAFIARSLGESWLTSSGQPLDGSAGRHLANFTSLKIYSYQWSPDGKSLALVRGDSPSDLVLIQNSQGKLSEPALADSGRVVGRTKTIHKRRCGKSAKAGPADAQLRRNRTAEEFRKTPQARPSMSAEFTSLLAAIACGRGSVSKTEGMRAQGGEQSLKVEEDRRSTVHQG
jgi:hypothetical protein